MNTNAGNPKMFAAFGSDYSSTDWFEFGRTDNSRLRFKVVNSGGIKLYACVKWHNSNNYTEYKQIF